MAIREDPSLTGKKVIICPTSNLSPQALKRSTSEVSSASYEARRCGVKSRMFIKDAFALCPDAIFLPCSYKKYELASKAFFDTLLKYTHHLQTVSADEAFLDLSHVGYDHIEETVRKIRNDVEESIGCPTSAGISCNILLSRLCTRKAKPHGQFTLLPLSSTSTSTSDTKGDVHNVDPILSFLNPLPVSDLPSVGEMISTTLNLHNIFTISDLRSSSKVISFIPSLSIFFHINNSYY